MPPLYAASGAGSRLPSAHEHSPSLLIDMAQAKPAVMDAIRGARKVVDVDLFSFLSRGSGSELERELLAARRRGVEVNVIMELSGSVGLPPGAIVPLIDRMRDGGISVHVAQRFSGTPALKHVDHRKLVVVDGTKAFLGGINFSGIQDSWHDAMVELRGPSAAQAAQLALTRWEASHGSASPLHRSVVADALRGAAHARPTSAATRLTINDPSTGTFELTRRYQELIDTAKGRLWIATPGLSDRAMIDRLVAAADRGVDVRLILPRKPPLGLPIITWGNRASFPRLIEHGVKVYETPEVSHTKAVLADDTAVIGSYNITRRSALHDQEIGAESRDARFVQQVDKMFTDDAARSFLLTGTEKRSAAQRVVDTLVQRFGIQY